MILFLNMVVVLFACGWMVVSYKHRLKRTGDTAVARLYYIRKLMDLVYTYSHRPEQLLRLLQTEMSIKKLLCYHVVEDATDGLIPDEARVSKNDRLLYQLHKEGFSPRELCVIFGLNNLNSVYVKYHRMNKRLRFEPVLSKPETME